MSSNINIAALERGVLRTHPYISIRSKAMDETIVSFSEAVAPLNSGIAIVLMNKEIKLFGVSLHHTKLGDPLEVVKYVVNAVRSEGHEDITFIDFDLTYSVSREGVVYIGQTAVANYTKQPGEGWQPIDQVIPLSIHCGEEDFPISPLSHTVMKRTIKTSMKG